MLRLPAVLTLAEASTWEAQLRQSIRQVADGQVVLDAGALLRFDSAALAVLLACRREALAAGKSFAVHAMASRLQALATLYGVDALMPSKAA